MISILNKNKKSVPISSLIITFSFKDTIVNIRKNPYFKGHSESHIISREYRMNGDGKMLSTESIPVDAKIYDIFSFTHEQVLSGGTIFNTNKAFFSCVEWPEYIGYAAEIFTSAKITNRFIGYLPGHFLGKYLFKIKNQIFTERISGSIIDSGQ